MRAGRLRARRVAASVLASACVALPSLTAAVTPLTPRLDGATRVALFAELAARGVPEVGHNSVALAMESVLGLRPAAATDRYDEPHPHLPKVAVTTTLAAGPCVGLTAVVASGSDPSATPLRVTGTYCLVGPARWASQDQRVEPAGR